MNIRPDPLYRDSYEATFLLIDGAEIWGTNVNKIFIEKVLIEKETSNTEVQVKAIEADLAHLKNDFASNFTALYSNSKESFTEYNIGGVMLVLVLRLLEAIQKNPEAVKQLEIYKLLETILKTEHSCSIVRKFDEPIKDYALSLACAYCLTAYIAKVVIQSADTLT